MTNTIFFLSLGPLSVIIFLLLEHWSSKPKKTPFNRIRVYLVIALIGLSVSTYASSHLLIPLVTIIVPFEIMSVSSIGIPLYLNMVLSFLLIDLCQYWVHRLHHKIPFLWRIHRLHHSDKDVDALTTFLHHPIEHLTTFVISTILFILFDIPMIVLVLYSIIFSVHAAFSHTTLKINRQPERYVGYVIVTPSIHRLHHALSLKESNSNFGQVFSFWDRVFNSYIKPGKTKKALVFGISKEQGPVALSIRSFLINPIKETGSPPISDRS